MALYPPIIDSSRAMQTGTGSVKVYYTYQGETKPISFEVSAINPRTGVSVRTSTEDINTTDNNYIEVPITGNIAQISLRSVYGENQVSIASQAVIFKLFNETLNITWDSDANIVSSPYCLMATLTSSSASDSLAWYQIEVKNNDSILMKTDKCYPKAKNTINEVLDYDFLCDKYASYTFEIHACTTNGILITKNATFNNSLQLTNSTKATISQSSNGVNIAWSNQIQDSSYIAKLYYADGNSWIVKETKTGVSSSGSTIFTNLKTRATKYRAVLYNSSSVIVQATEIFWYAAYGQDILLKQDAQTSYLIKYNPEINQIKRNITDIITPTLGAKYPFVYRNGHQNYRTFSIGGLIARYDNTNDVTYIGTDEDIIQERLYREKLLDFLYNDKVKLFSSAQEGEMLIKLSGVSVTPMKQLGRMLYSFSATATEIADCTKDNLEAFGIEG